MQIVHHDRGRENYGVEDRFISPAAQTRLRIVTTYVGGRENEDEQRATAKSGARLGISESATPKADWRRRFDAA